MKVNFPLPTDGKMHRICLKCGNEGVEQIKVGENTMYSCPTCGHVDGISHYFNKHKVWLDDTKELWHASCGIFLKNKDGKFLFFQRTEYPLTMTIPSGHVDEGETDEASAARELAEETGVDDVELTHVAADKIVGDKCSAAAECHSWNTYLAHYTGKNGDIEIADEGKMPTWLTLDEALAKDLNFAVRYVITHHRRQLEKL